MNPPLTNLGKRAVALQVIVLKMCYGAIKNFTYLLVDPDAGEAIIVDPAWDMAKVDQALLETRAKLIAILITHAHPDHIHLAKPIADKYHCPIWMSPEEIATSGFNDSQLLAFDAKPWVVGKMSIEPILTPGHTPGSTCFLIGDNLFTGDVLFTEGCGICPDTRAAHEMFASLQHLKRRLKPQTRIFPGHSYGEPPGQMLSRLLSDNIYLQFSDKETFAAFRMRGGQDMARLFNFS